MLQFKKLFLMVFALFAGSVAADAQFPVTPSSPPPSTERVREPRTISDVIRQRQIAQQRREHENMLKRGEDAVKLAEELEASLDNKEVLSASDKKKLDDLERLVTRIRRDLGGGGDGLSIDEDDEIETPNTSRDAAAALKEMTIKLFDELKQTSRFTVSAVAIQSANTALRIARFLKIRR